MNSIQSLAEAAAGPGPLPASSSPAHATESDPPLIHPSSPSILTDQLPRRLDEDIARRSISTSHLRSLGSASPPLRKDTSSSVSTQATIASTATAASAETNNTSYSADTSPSLHQSIFSIKDGSDVSNSRRTSRRRTGPLSQQSRERAALIRKLGACNDCRRRRVAVCYFYFP